MTIDEAKEIIRKGIEHHELGHTYNPFLVQEAKGFIAGYESRTKSVEGLLEALRLCRKSFSASVADYKQPTAGVCGIIDDDNLSMWEDEIVCIDKALSEFNQSQGGEE